MKLRHILAGTALAALTLAGAPQLGVPAFTTQAQAAVDVSIGVFYNQLGQYGDWVNYDNDYVFIPGRVDANWRPYTQGHWVYAKRYGWTWASDEPFGWATYHYGRWGYSEDIGWYWVPGRRWAPAWVSWRRSNNYVVWAPLPPSRHGGGVDVSINVNVNDIPDYYWVAVPTQRFLAPDLRVDIVNNDTQIRQVVQETRYIGTPRITNNIVVNNVINVNEISRDTGQTVQPVEVRTTTNPTEAKAGANQVTVFQGELKADTNAKPQKVVDVAQAKKVKRPGANAGTDQNATGQNGTTQPSTGTGTGSGTATAPVDNTNGGTASGTTGTGNGTNEATAPATGKDKKKLQNQNATGTTGAQPTNQAQDQQTGGKNKKKKLQNENASTPDTTGQQPTNQAQGQTTGKHKKKLQNDNASTPDMSGQQPTNQAQDQQTGGKNKKKKLQNENASTPDTTGQQPTNQAQDQTTGKHKKKLQPGEDATGSTSAAPAAKGGNANGNGAGQQDQNGNAPANNGNAKAKGKKNQTTCDPNTDASCASAQ